MKLKSALRIPHDFIYDTVDRFIWMFWMVLYIALWCLWVVCLVVIWFVWCVCVCVCIVIVFFSLSFFLLSLEWLECKSTNDIHTHTNTKRMLTCIENDLFYFIVLVHCTLFTVGNLCLSINKHWCNLSTALVHSRTLTILHLLMRRVSTSINFE